MGLHAVFNPRRVAVVGASERPGTVGRLLWDNLIDFPGDVLPICRGDTIFGHPAYPTLTAAPGDIDLAVVAVPAAEVLEVIRAAVRKHLAAAVILSAGFAETGDRGAALQRAVRDVALAGGVRIVGPNSFGVQNCRLPLNASIAVGLPNAPGDARPGISLVTQSGAYGMMADALGRDESARFAKVYAAGNKADLADHEVLAYLADDPDTAVVCLMLESISEPRKFFRQARRATAGKPVIATVVGRSASGRRAALSHTASIGTDDVLRDDLLRQAGVVRTRTGVQMLDAARAIADQGLPAGRRVGIVTNSGGLGVELADLLADEELTVPELSEVLQQQLREFLPAYASPRNPVDLTPVWSRFPELYSAGIDRLARSGEVDVVVAVLVQRAASGPVAVSVRDAVLALRRAGIDIPVYVCWAAPRADRQHADLLQAAGVPCLSWPERTAQTIGVAVRCAAVLARPEHRVGRRPAVSRPPTRHSTDVPVEFDRQRDLLDRAGICLARTELCSSPADAIAAAAAIGYPVVAKVVHPALTHKSDVGGVRIGLFDDAAVGRASAQLLALAPGATVAIQEQHHGLELAVGGIRDAELGPMVMVGLGGVAVELMADTRFALAPLDVDEAAQLWGSLRHACVLDGFRGAPAVDVGALASLTMLIGELMVEMPALSEIDLNPVLATPHGYVVVDWRMNGRHSALR